MKSKVVTVLSVLGVVSAGAAAGVVNTQALQGKVAGTVGDSTALLGTASPVVPTPVVTITRTAAPVAVKTVIVPAPGSQAGTSNSVQRVVKSTPTHRVTVSSSSNRETIDSVPVVAVDPTTSTPVPTYADQGPVVSGPHAYSGGSSAGTPQGSGASGVNGQGTHEQDDNRGDDSNEGENGDD